MLKGEWDPNNGECIKIAKDGTLIDGQHRLYAIIKAGIPVQVMVMVGLDLSAQDTIDRGRKRNLADILTMRGDSRCTLLSASSQNIIRWERNGPENGFLNGNRSGKNYITPKDALDFIEENVEELYTDIRKAAQISKAIGGIPISNWVCLIYKLSELSPELAQEFFDGLISGANLAETDPIFVLRNTIVRITKNGKGAKVPPRYGAALVIKAWNAYMRQTPIHRITFRLVGPNRDDFPSPLAPSIASL